VADVWKAAFQQLCYELTRLKCSLPVDDPKHDRECARCVAINKAHELKYKAKNRRAPK
jgi:hypothetical protein